MGDAGHRTIDSIYDAAERVVDGVGRALGVDTRAADADAIPYAPPNLAALKDANVRALPAPVRAQLAAPAFQIIEAADGSFEVTNGTASARCASRAFAEQVLAAIATAPPAPAAGRFAAGGGRNIR